MIVMKFGGTSVEDARSMKNSIQLVKRELHKGPIVVVSAIAGATNTLLSSARLSVEGKLEQATQQLSDLHERHVVVLENVVETRSTVQQILMELKKRFEELKNLCTGIAILGELTNRSLDAISSVGERLSSMIMAEGFKEDGIGTELVDARSFMVTDDHFGNATPLLDEVELLTKAKLSPHVRSNRLVVTQGFIGSTHKGVTTTLGRGGSDYSAAIIGTVLNAQEIQIWTDVDGVMTADPRIVPDARKLKVISFREASELAYFGAKVLHPSTILPAVKKNIPVVVLNSKRPQSSGTQIVENPPKSNAAVKSIASKRGITVVNVQSTRMLMAYGFLESIFSVFRKHKTPVDLVSTSEVAVSLTIDNVSRLDDIVNDLREYAEVSLYEKKAILCIVGEQMQTTAGIADRIFHALGDINVTMISQGASEINMSLVIDEYHVTEAVRRLHREFFEPVPELEIFETVEN
ncbi:MAG: lysine-sensitive aspartokinase 3 [Ignavibacteriales bacterium]|nr:lysine-sensitive aspartokinase 3 [Ignavibacteriales bacterium]